LILIVTNSEDATASLVTDELIRRGVEFFRVDTDRFPSDYAATASFGSGRKPTMETVLCTTGQRAILGDVRSVWYRRPVRPIVSPEIQEEAVAGFASDETYEFLRGLWLSCDSYWLSHPEAIRIAERKVVQLNIASRLGFEIPQTVVTNDPDKVIELRRMCHNGIVVKPLYIGFVDDRQKPLSIYTNRLADEDYDQIETVRLAPSIYQEAIDKIADLRVTVVGKRVFSARIDGADGNGETPDWRCLDLKELTHSVYELPADLERACLELVSSLKLEFGAIDFAIDRNGQHIFLEVNANGQWGWIEKLTGLPITTAIADLLISND